MTVSAVAGNLQTGSHVISDMEAAMKTAICITAGIAVMLLTGCSNQDGPLDTGGADNGTAPFAVAKSSAPREIVQDESIISTQASSVNADRKSCG